MSHIETLELENKRKFAEDLEQARNKKRERILGIVGTSYPISGTEKFGHLSLGRFEELLAEGFMELRHYKMYPEFIRFMKQFPFMRAVGYAVSPKRHDTRIVVEGLEFSGFVAKSVQEAFKEHFENADEYICNANKLYCWYKI